MNSLASSPTKESMLIKIVNLSLNTLKYAFAHIRGKIGELPNQRRETVSREIICFLLLRAE